MLSFDKVPVMDREYFEQCFKKATSFGVWVQINPALQKLVSITAEQAKEIAYEGLAIMPIWGMLSQYDCLELSQTSQWGDSLAEKNMKFVWKGYADPYDSCYAPTLLNDKKKIVWQGSHYYGGEISEQKEKLRRELEVTAKRFNILGYDFSSNTVSDWKLEDQRSWSNG